MSEAQVEQSATVEESPIEQVAGAAPVAAEELPSPLPDRDVASLELELQAVLAQQAAESPPPAVALPSPAIPSAEEKLQIELARQIERSARLEKELEAQRLELQHSEAALGSTQRELASARARVDELTNRLLRATGDFENFRRRTKREAEDTKRYCIEGLLKELLPVLDNLERALEAVPGDSPIATGIRLVHRLFLDVVGRFGLVGFESLDQPFDPTHHEAAEVVVRPGVPAGLVVQVLQKGYMLHERLTRPALVLVSREAPVAPAPSPTEVPAPSVEAGATPGASPPGTSVTASDPGPASSVGEAGGEGVGDDPGLASEQHRTGEEPGSQQEIVGILVGSIPTSTLAELNLPGGVEVLELRVPSPGARSGLVRGDIVTGVGNRSIHDPQEFVRAVRLALQQRQGLKFRYLRSAVEVEEAESASAVHVDH